MNTTLTDREVYIRTIKAMKKDAKNEFVISVFDEMLSELETGDPESVITPSYLSIIRFNYNLFDPFRMKQYRDALEEQGDHE